MEVIVYINDVETEKLNIEKDSSSFYEAVGEILGKAPIPSTVKVSCEYGNAKYTVGTRSNTRLVSRVSNSINLPQLKVFPEKYLVMVNSDCNNYKFYHLKQEVVNGDIIACWGRIGDKRKSSCAYPADMFWVKYFEKTAKGYEDKTSFYIKEEKEEEQQQDIKEKAKNTKMSKEDEISFNLFKLLKSFAKRAIESQTVMDAKMITEAMVSESKRLLNLLYETTNVESFNERLKELLAVCPRKVSKVNVLLAKTDKDFSYIIDREESLINAMEVLVAKEEGSISNTLSEENPFKTQNIEVFVATDKQKESVFKHLPNDLQQKVKNIYRIVPKAQQERFDKYLKENKIEKVKRFWHGSRNENWLSIVLNSLSLNPNAVITGKMFGNGIYFAPKAHKSWNYTSYHNTYWAKGNSSTAFMGLYTTAYGTPLDCEHAHSYTKKELGDKNCVHAHAGEHLRNDEIIFYDENAMVLSYLVEFGD